MMRVLEVRATVFCPPHLAVLAGFCIALPHIALADMHVSDQIVNCRTIEDSSERLECYDNFIDQHQGSESSQPEIAQVPRSEPNIQSVPADFGSETLPAEDRKDIEKPEVRAVVTSCSKNALGRYLFFFENGHVWKQTNEKRLRFDDCDFEVTITKDFFGYKMRRAGDTAQIRISRVK